MLNIIYHIDKGLDGGWSSWKTKTDNNCQVRSRSCTNPSPCEDGSQCEGPGQETISCQSGRMSVYGPTDGNWGLWSPWSPCSVSCGGGVQTRYDVVYQWQFIFQTFIIQIFSVSPFS